MKIRNFVKNEEAVSITVGFILTFSITVLVFSGIILAFYELSVQSKEKAMQESFAILGSGLAMRMTTVDTLINITNTNGGTVNTLEYDFSIPAFIANEGYSINFSNSTRQLILESESSARTWVPFNVSGNFTQKEIYSNDENFKITYNKTDKIIKIEQQ